MEPESVVQDIPTLDPAGAKDGCKTTDEGTDKTNDVEKEDEFAYLDATGFTSERFKIEIKNLPKYYGISEMKKLLNVKLKLSTNKIKIMRPGCPFIFVCFRDESARQAAIKALDGFMWKGKKLHAIEAKPSPDPLVKRRNESAGDVVNIKKRRTLEESVTALSYLSYEDQLKQKQSEMRNVLTSFGNEAWRSCSSLRPYIEAQRKEHDGLPCQLEDIRASPKTDGYRNKCEFSIGKNEHGEIRVGFRVGSYSNGFLEVESPKNLKNVSDSMKYTVELFEEYVQQSKYEVYSAETYKGYFRQLTVRTSTDTGEIMVVVGIHPQSLSKEELQELKDSLVQCFSTEKAKEIGISSIYFEPMEKRMPGQNVNSVEHLYGETHIVDVIHGLQFRISPLAFFQINTPSAEVLYQCAIDMAQPSKQTSILDICCGTGTIGLCFAKHCKQVLGVEIIPQAIEDAQYNADLNKVDNCKFYAGNADDLLTCLIRNANIQQDESLVAIVDPPRAGLHIRSIAQLRNARGLDRLIYVSCSPKSAIKNWIDLMRPCSKELRGLPFVAKKAIPVDMFPHTPHCELLILFERKTERDGSDKALSTSENKTNEADEEELNSQTPTNESESTEEKNGNVQSTAGSPEKIEEESNKQVGS
ncbi:tRNA (uracil-5-)-methyltransferase homolog A [Toxorhynchites rutilus septentrionalis]|uniref:tRNA (uracil-5-)-methyltransferase homolog A n=1 Tax=Toxorhynchites rutilus septentrionalis TaxID=329112 RepID=UPI0024791F66|nr:tRNA (uracil-5-)-methyltransferase homolog A [Toxorhynchites rutilus septentrionalis]